MPVTTFILLSLFIFYPMLKNTRLKRSALLVIILLVVLLVVNVTTHAQTPSSLPGPTPGVTTANGGDGSPEVPFDEEMSLLFAAFGITYTTMRVKSSRQLMIMINCNG